MARGLIALVALACCAHHHPDVVLGETVPRGCEKDKANESERCEGFWYGRMVAMFGMRSYDDRAMTAYVAGVGKRLARHAGGNIAWSFHIADDTDVQAFSIIGGQIYITRGLLAILRTEAELAAVLGHEMGHVLGGHSREPLAESDRNVDRSSEAKHAQQRWARDDEIQADEIAVVLTARAGYTPGAVVDMLRALAGTERYDSSENPDAVHPWWPDRIARATALVAHYATAGERGEARYRANLASLVTGADPRDADVVDRAIVFERVDLAVDLPEGAIAKRGGDRSVDVTFADGTTARLVVMTKLIAELTEIYASEHRDGTATAIRVAGDDAVVVTAKGSYGALHAIGIRDAFRAPRPTERTRLHPTRVDLNAPRRLWSR